MRKLAMSLMAVALMAVTVSLAEAKDRSKTINFLEDVKVNGTLVKKGEYDVKFDADTNEISILRNGNVVATAKVEVKPTEKKMQYNSAGFVDSQDGKLLTSITFQGDRRILMVNSVNGQPAGGEQ